MTDPTTILDLSTPEKVADLRADLAEIEELISVLFAAAGHDPSAARVAISTLTRRRDRIIAALDTLPREG